MKAGWHGPVIDTLINLYDQLSFLVKSNCLVSPRMFNKFEVNQGGIASGVLLFKYLANLESYLSSEHGICISDGKIGHLLWVDDLTLFSDTFYSVLKQLNRLQQFCANNHKLVN